MGDQHKRLVNVQLRFRALRQGGVVARYTVGQKYGWRRESCHDLQEAAMQR
jgi:hypothetical protein